MTFESGLINDVRKEGDVVIKNINPMAPHARKESDYKIIEDLKQKFSANDIPVVIAKEVNSFLKFLPRKTGISFAENFCFKSSIIL